MVIQRTEQLRLKGLVIDAIANLCKSGLSFKSEFCIEGLLGITLDNNDIILLNIKETVTSHEKSCLSADTRDLCDLGNQAAIDAHFLNGAMNTSLDFSKTGLLSDKSDKQDAFQLNALDLNINGKLSDLEMLFDISNPTSNISNTPGKRQDLLPMDMTTSFLAQEQDVDQLIAKDDNNPKTEDDEDGEMSDNSDLVVVKEERERQLLNAENLAQVSKHSELQFMPFDPTSISSQAETMFLNLKGDEPLASCSGWEATEYLEEVPLNLSDPTDTQPQDLSTNQTKQKSRHVCDVCGRKFRSEGGLNKHRDKEHSDSLLSPGAPLSLVMKEPAQPLDLTTASARGDNDTLDELEPELGAGGEPDSFTCICSKVINDYEAYVEHVTHCNKSKLTPCKSCEICGKYFFSNSGYVKHKRLHVGAYKFHCEVCRKGFFDRTHLSAHMDSSHSKVRRYECESCNKSFFWKHHLKRHKITCSNKQKSGGGKVGPRHPQPAVPMDMIPLVSSAATGAAMDELPEDISDDYHHGNLVDSKTNMIKVDSSDILDYNVMLV